MVRNIETPYYKKVLLPFSVSLVDERPEETTLDGPAVGTPVPDRSGDTDNIRMPPCDV